MKHKISACLFMLFFIYFPLVAQVDWKAYWISHENSELTDYTVLHFRNSFTLSAIPQTLPLKVSADIRYKMYVNGNYVAQGPANNDLQHYVFDEQDIASFLIEGKNTIAFTVFNMGMMNPVRFETSGAKLIVQAEGEMGKILNTGSGSWKVYHDDAYEPTFRGADFEIISYFAMGGGEKITASKYPWGWKKADYNDAGWKLAVNIIQGQNYGNNQAYGAAELSLQERKIPFMDESPETKPVLREGKGSLNKSFINAWKKDQPLEIPANSEATILLDQTYLTKGHPYYTFSGGKNAEVKVSYAETMFVDIKSKEQGHRDIVEGKEFIGLSDIYILDGGSEREFTTLIPRVWRYIQVQIKTAGEPLKLNNFRATKFIYPFKENAFFKSDAPLHKNIWNVGWRTAQLCTDETYMDCPYYEQLQYVGDTRIQALISLYVSGDDRLMKNAINQFANSVTDEGITQSRFPANILQYIPPYSLFWVDMVHDYHMHRKDEAFTKQYLPKIASVLFWFENKLQEDNMMGPLPWWSYVDVVKGWPKSSPPGAWEGGSSFLSLQYIYTLQEAIELFKYYEKDFLVQHFTEVKNRVQKAVVEKSFIKEAGVFADTEKKDKFSQHTNIMAILTDTAPVEQQSKIFQTITSDTSFAKTNIYFTFYLHKAAQKSGNGDYFLNNLSIWENMLQKGLTTFAETTQNTRSDCHAWSASPVYEYLNTVCGIQPAAHHFKEIKIAPNPGNLTDISGKMPHPQGEIAVQYKINKSKVTGEINIPEGTKGVFVWKGKEMPLKPGKNIIKM